MAIDKRLKIYDDQGHDVDYDIMADDVKFLPDGKDLPTKLAEMEEEIGEGGYNPPAGGIPATDLAPAVQTSLGKADTALQEADKNQLQAAINAVQTALNALIGGNVQGAIDTFNEVTAFLNGIDTSDPTLKNQLLALNNAITALGNSLATVATSGSYNDLSNKPTILSQQQVAGMIEDAIEDLPTGDIPTKVSELDNDEGYITAAEVGEIVATTGDIAIVESSDYVDIMIYSPEMSVKLGGNEVSSLAFFSDPTQQESLSLAVSGSHLKANIVATLEGADANKFSISGSPITQSGGAASGTLTVAYTGTTAAGQSANATLKLTCGDFVKTISLHYAYASGPFISVNPASLAFKAGTGSTETKTLAISASQLTGDVVVSTPSGSAFQVCATENGTYGNSVTVAKADAEAGKTIYVKYTAGSSAATASLTVASTGATSRTVALSGAVAGTLSISPASGTIGIQSGESGTATFIVQGANLTPNSSATVDVAGTGMSADKQSLTVGQDGSINGTVTVTFSGSADSNGTLTISHNDAEPSSVSASVAGRIVQPLPSGASFDVGGIHYKVNSNQTSVRVWNGTNEDWNGEGATKYSGAVTIPASVSDSGVTASLSGGGTQAGNGMTYTVTSIAVSAFKNCTALTSVVLPNTIKTISMMAFNGATNLASINLPNGLTTIGGAAFGGITALLEIDIPDSVTTLGASNLSGVFFNSTGLKSAIIGDGVSTIFALDKGVFRGCSGLRTVQLGRSSAAAIGGQAINDMFNTDSAKNVTKIICYAATPPTSGGYTTFAQTVLNNATVYVPAASLNTYKTTAPWSSFAEGKILTIESMTE